MFHVMLCKFETVLSHADLRVVLHFFLNFFSNDSFMDY
jgi:hypothetical protein